MISAATSAFALSRGFTVDELRRETDLDLDLLLNPSARKPDDTTTKLWNALAARDRELCPLDKSRATPMSSLEGVAQAVTFARTLHEMLTLFVEARSVVAGRLDLHLEYSEHEVRLVMAHPNEVLDQGRTNVAGLGVFFRALTEAMDMELAPTRVEFRNRRHGAESKYRDVFGCPVAFEAKETAIVFAPEALYQPSPHGNQELFAYVRTALLEKRRLTRPVQDDRLTRLCRAISDNAEQGVFSAQAAAQRAHMALRTAQRVLAENQASMSVLITDVRMDHAKRLLRRSDLTLSDIASALDYADDRSFRRAFHRWEGITPTAFRLEHRGTPSRPSAASIVASK